MWGKFVAKLATSALRRADLSIESRNLLTTAVLKELGALPLHDMITTNQEGNLLVNGRPLDLESARILRESARAALENQAFKFVREQVLFNSVVLGVHKAETDKQMYFARASIWWGQEEDKILRILAQSEGQS